MRAAIAISVLLIACHGDADAKQEAAASRRVQLVYDIDLDLVVNDLAAEARRDLAADLGASAKSIAISATGEVEVTPSDPTKQLEIHDEIERSYRDQATWRTCDRSAVALCFEMSDSVVTAAKRAALARAVTTIQKRLVASKLDGVTVIAKGQQIVVELPVVEAAVLEGMRSMIAKKGGVELKVVDDGSDYMRRLFAHVAGDPQTGAAADRSATAAGVRAEVETWSPDIGPSHTDYYLVAGDKRAIERYVAELGAADPTFEVPDDRELGYERIEPKKPGDPVKVRSYYLERAASLDGSAIAKAQVAFDPVTNRPTVSVELGRKGARDFAELTTRIAGKKLATVVDGMVASAPVVMGPIRGGRLSITMGGADPAAMQRAATDLVAVLESGALPAPLRLASQRLVP